MAYIEVHRPHPQILSEDYSKAAFLCADRSVHLHAKYGAHFRTRVPRAGRDLAYASDSADLLIAASSPDIYRRAGEGVPSAAWPNPPCQPSLTMDKPLAARGSQNVSPLLALCIQGVNCRPGAWEPGVLGFPSDLQPGNIPHPATRDVLEYRSGQILLVGKAALSSCSVISTSNCPLVYDSTAAVCAFHFRVFFRVLGGYSRVRCDRLNLAEGCFLAPLQSGSPGVNALAISPAHGLLAAAGEGGLLECFDLRQRRCAGALDAAAAAGAVSESNSHALFPAHQERLPSQEAEGAKSWLCRMRSCPVGTDQGSAEQHMRAVTRARGCVSLLHDVQGPVLRAWRGCPLFDITLDSCQGWYGWGHYQQCIAHFISTSCKTLGSFHGWGKENKP